MKKLFLLLFTFFTISQLHSAEQSNSNGFREFFNNLEKANDKFNTIIREMVEKNTSFNKLVSKNNKLVSKKNAKRKNKDCLEIPKPFYTTISKDDFHLFSEVITYVTIPYLEEMTDNKQLNLSKEKTLNKIIKLQNKLNLAIRLKASSIAVLPNFIILINLC